MLYRNLFLPLLLLFSAGLAAQAGPLDAAERDTLDAAVPRLSALTETIYTDSTEAARFGACREFIRELVDVLAQPNSFSYDFGEVPGLSVTYAPDSTFRIFSWELYVDRDIYRHYGAIQMNEEQLVLTPLVDRGDYWLENPENAIVGADNWLGYVVYDIVAAGEYRGTPYYFVFGYDSYEGYRRQKVLDVLSFDGEGKAQFGLPVFYTFDENQTLLADRARMTLVYGAEATVALRYDPEQGGVVYENLIMMPGSYGEGPVNMPDGSYRMLKLEDDGLWHEVEQVFTHKYEEAPREVPKPSEGRDILGRGKTPRGEGEGGGN